MSESQQQRALIAWASMTRIPPAPDLIDGARVSDYLHAIPNGGARSIVTAALLKAEGVKAGVHDLFLPVPRQGAHGLWIELKHGKNKMSAAQKEWAVKMMRAGYLCVTCWSWDSAARHVSEYLGIKP